MQRMRVTSSAAAQTVARQFTAALRGHTRAAYTLDDDGFDEAAFIGRAERSGLTFALRWYATVKLTCAALRPPGRRARLLDRFAGAVTSNFAYYFTTEFAFYAALMLLRLAAEADPDERPALLAAHTPTPRRSPDGPPPAPTTTRTRPPSCTPSRPPSPVTSPRR
jgi:hypothetical protein